jgi:putative inorganic carbon (hco3(-)) transporter
MGEAAPVAPADRPDVMPMLRFSLPIARSRVHPRIAAISRWLPGVLLIAWVLTLPLEFTKLYFPNQAIEVSRIVLVLCVLAFAGQVLIERREVRIPASASVLGLALYTIYATASAAAVGSVQGTKTALAMIAYLLMMLTVFNWTQSFADHRRIWSALAVTAVALAVVGLIFHATSFYIWNEPNAGVLRVNATFRDPNIFARFLAFAILTMVVLAADVDVTVRQRALWVIAAVSSAVVIAFTYSRAGWGFTFVSAVAVMALAKRRRRALALFGFVVAAFAVVAFIDPSVLSRAALLAENLQSPFNNRAFIDRAPWLQFLNYLPVDSVRQYLIGAGLIMFVDHPIFGIGFGAFSQALAGGAYAGLVPPGVATTASHTSLITIVAETGVVGLAVVLLTGFFFVRSMVQGGFQSQVERTLVLAPVIGLLLIVLDSQFSGRLFDESYLWLFLGLAYSARAGLRDASTTLPRAAPAEVA